MTLVRRVARPMLAAMFVQGGIDQLRHPAERAKLAAPLVEKVAQPLGLPNDPEMLVRANGAVMTGAGTLLAMGRVPRLSALALAVSIVPTTATGHAFWQEKDPATRRQQRTQFLKNVSMLGGLLIAAVDTEGRPGLPWRARHAAKDAKRMAARTKREARQTARAARREARLAAHKAGDAVPFTG